MNAKKDLPDLAFLDCETGGLDPAEADIVELAAYRMRHVPDGVGYSPALLCIDSMHRYVLPRKPVHPDAAKVNGYTPEAWKAHGAVHVEDVLPEFDRFLVGATPAGQNPAFDMRFIKAAYEESNRDVPKHDYHLVDVAMLAWPFVIAGVLPGQGLKHSCVLFGLGEQKHDAKSDIERTIKVYVSIMQLYVEAALQRGQAGRTFQFNRGAEQ